MVSRVTSTTNQNQRQCYGCWCCLNDSWKTVARSKVISPLSSRGRNDGGSGKQGTQARSPPSRRITYKKVLARWQKSIRPDVMTWQPPTGRSLVPAIQEYSVVAGEGAPTRHVDESKGARAFSMRAAVPNPVRWRRPGHRSHARLPSRHSTSLAIL